MGAAGRFRGYECRVLQPQRKKAQGYGRGGRCGAAQGAAERPGKIFRTTRHVLMFVFYVAGCYTRTTVEEGTRTPGNTVVTGLLMLVFLVTITRILSFLPLCALAASVLARASSLPRTWQWSCGAPGAKTRRKC